MTVFTSEAGSPTGLDLGFNHIFEPVLAFNVTEPLQRHFAFNSRNNIGMFEIRASYSSIFIEGDRLVLLARSLEGLT